MPIEIHLEKRINNNVVREPDARSHRDYVVVTVFGAMFRWAVCLRLAHFSGSIRIPD